MPTLVGRGHGEFIMGSAGAPADLTNTLAPGTPGENLPGHILENGQIVPAPVMGGGKRKSRTVRRKKRRRTKHKKPSKKHPQTRRRKPRSNRRKRRVKVHKQEGKGGYSLVGHGMGAGPHTTYGQVVEAPTC